ncbi:LPXTG cell wall anchor domain-containing protein [Streptacidiphilus sp. PAMC 29251]
MAHLRARGIVRRTGAAFIAVSVVSLGMVATAPAHAAAKSVFGFIAPDTQILLPQSEGGAAADFRMIPPLIVSEGPSGTLTGVTLTIDASTLKGVAELSLPEHCSFTAADHLHAACSLGTLGPISALDLGIRSAAGAAEGAKGSIVFKATATNATEDPEDTAADRTTPVVVGHGPDLAVGPLGDISLAPGASTSESPQVSNKGDRDAKGIVLLLDAGELDGGNGLSFTDKFSNCLYHYGDSDQPVADRTEVLCSFPDVTVHPGETYQVAGPLTLAATAKATKGYFEYGFDLADGESADPDATGVAGTGPALGLSLLPAAGANARSQDTDIDYSNNTAVSLVSTGRIDDVAVTAGNVTGTVGRTTHFHTTVKNTGTVPTEPMDGAPSPDITAVDLVVFPLGVKVVKAPGSCEAMDDSLSTPPAAQHRFAAKLKTARIDIPADGGSTYLCTVGKVLTAGQSAAFDFTVKPTKVLHQAVGLAEAVSGANLGLDDNPDNNVVNFTVSATAAQATAKPTPTPTRPAPSTTTSGTAAPTGSGGNLAATGGGSDTLPIALSGAAAVLLGAGGVLFARRRTGARS